VLDRDGALRTRPPTWTCATLLRRLDEVAGYRRERAPLGELAIDLEPRLSLASRVERVVLAHPVAR
jgi:hypothetical protein